MTNKRPWRISSHWIIVALAALVMVACSSSPPSTPQGESETTEHTPTAESKSITQNTSSTPESTSSTTEIFKPYPYTTPLPLPTPTKLDGIYTRNVNFEGTPTPCRRCAAYRAEGGTWTLNLKAGVFRVSHDGTDFQGVGSFTVSEDRIVFFNDPNCHLGVGTYTWELDGRSLKLKEVEDGCAFGLRAENLAAGSWIRLTDEEGQQIDRCQPPSTEAAITDHWPSPPGCEMVQGKR